MSDAIRNRIRWWACRAAFKIAMTDALPEPIWFRLLPWIGEYAHFSGYDGFCQNAEHNRRLVRDPAFRAKIEAEREREIALFLASTEK